MKIRSGFVSNSSSSSFILTGTFQQIMDNVKSMAEFTAADLQDNYCVDGVENLMRDEDLLEQVRTSDLGLHLPSVNYETYIRVYNQDYQNKNKDSYKAYIETCNNLNWEECISGSYDRKGEDDESYGEMYRANREMDRFFIYLENNNIIRTAEHYVSLAKRYVKCSNKKCGTNRPRSSGLYTMYFDTLYQPRCTQCDALIIGTDAKFSLKKKQQGPDHIIPGLL